MTHVSKLKTTSYSSRREWGLDWRDSSVDVNGNVYAFAGCLYPSGLGLTKVHLSVGRRGQHDYSAMCSVDGRVFWVRQERSGKPGYRSLCIWAWRHAIPALRDAVDEATS